jgi:hypothetical protein
MMIRAYINEERDNWDESLALLLMAYRSTVQESTGCSPNLMMLGREVETPLDVQYYPGDIIARQERCGVQYAEWLRDSMRTAHRIARDNLQKAAQRQKRNYDSRAHVRRFGVGDWVYYQDFRNSQVKLGLKWRGPFLVIRRPGDVNLTIQQKEGATPITVHVDQVKMCHGTHIAEWLSTSGISTQPEAGENVIEGLPLEEPVADPEAEVLDPQEAEVLDPQEVEVFDQPGAEVSDQSVSQQENEIRTRSGRVVKHPDRLCYS